MRMTIPGMLIACCGVLACSSAPSTRPTVGSAAVVRDRTEGAPAETTGILSSMVGTLSAAASRELLESGVLRVREVVLEPGVSIAVHSHDSRPAVAYVIDGEVIEHRGDSRDPLVRRSGDAYVEGPGLVHWVGNVSPNQVRVVTVDIIPGEVQGDR